METRIANPRERGYEFVLSDGKKINIKEGYPLYDKFGNIVKRIKSDEDWTVDMAWQDMAFNPEYIGVKNSQGFITNIDDLKHLPMYKINKLWIEKMKNEGYEVIGIGNPTLENTESLFYNMEKSTMGF